MKKKFLIISIVVIILGFLFSLFFLKNLCLSVPSGYIDEGIIYDYTYEECGPKILEYLFIDPDLFRSLHLFSEYKSVEEMNASKTKTEKSNDSNVLYSCADRFENPDKFEEIISSSKTCGDAVSLALNYECRAGSTMDLYPDSLAADICRKEFEINNPSDDLREELKNNFDMCEQIDEGGGTLELSQKSACALGVLYESVSKSKK